MATYTVKLSKRAALRKLEEESCNIYVEKARSYFITERGVTNNTIHIPKEQITIPVTDITKIEMPISRFTPDKMCWMEIDWDNNSPASGTQN